MFQPKNISKFHLHFVKSVFSFLIVFLCGFFSELLPFYDVTAEPAAIQFPAHARVIYSQLLEKKAIFFFTEKKENFRELFVIEAYLKSVFFMLFLCSYTFPNYYSF